MSLESPQPPSEEATRFKDAMRRILSLTPAQREEVKRKVAEEVATTPEKRKETAQRTAKQSKGG